MSRPLDTPTLASRMMSAPIHAALREATAVAHERLHHLPAFAPLVAGTISREAYVALMARTHGFHAALEPAIGAALETSRFASVATACRRLALLREDLLTLGLAPAAIDALPVAVPPGLATPAAALGCLYVLEGSTLGGRHLARQLDHLLPAGTRVGRCFLEAGASAGHVAWRDFVAVIETAAVSSSNRADMIAMAVETFQHFEAWFVAAKNIP